MAKGVFTTKLSPSYDDLPELRYHFPRTYLRQVEQTLGDTIVYYEPRRSTADASSRGGRQIYFAIARPQSITQDPVDPNLFFCHVADYLDFERAVPFRSGEVYRESMLQRDDGGTNKGAFGRSVRIVRMHVFRRDMGLHGRSSWRGRNLIDSLARLLALMTHHGAYRIYAKRLSPNDNSKNQVYLGGGFAALNVLPHGEIYVDATARGGSKQDRPKAALRFFWINEDGKHLAPDANLILYPDYPEVRMSGFLRGCESAPSRLMTVRDEGRVLFFGVTRDGRVLGFVTDAGSPISNQINSETWPTLGVFLELPLSLDGPTDPKAILLAELRRIHDLRWIGSQKLARTGAKRPYAARNGGGYTLEAELGVQPNGYAEPDFMGWEVKQYGVRDFAKFAPKSVVTLFTPEPTGGFYRTGTAEKFVERFGYLDKSGKPDRINFGGVYACQKAAHADTGLRMTLKGFDAGVGKITDMDGGLALITEDGEEAATWSFSGLMAHWNRKHAQAAYVPSLYRSPPPEYRYGPQILLCEQTDFILFLKAFATGAVYYDPALKLERTAPGKQELHRRSQFRIHHSNLTRMYHRHQVVSVTN